MTSAEQRRAGSLAARFAFACRGVYLVAAGLRPWWFAAGARPLLIGVAIRPLWV